jgi:hypothetical protein
MTNTLEEAKATFAAEATHFVSSTPQENRATAQQLAKQRLAQQVVTYQRSLVSSTQAGRDELLSVLRIAAEQAEAIQAVVKAPISLLSRIALGDPKRTQLIQQLDFAGPMELEQHARAAVMTGDLVLASAVAAVVGSMPKADQPFSAIALAEAVLGDVFTRISQKLTTILLNYRSAMQADQQFATGKVKTIDSIALALAKRGNAQPAASGAAA